MKIAISATGPSLDAEVDPRFGRCQYFVIVDPQATGFETLENPSMGASSGAGITTAQMIANKGVEVVLTGNCGPNAYQTLSAAGVRVITGVSGIVRDAIEGYKAGRFQPTAQPTVGANYGMGRGGGMGGGMGRGRGRGMGMAPGTVPPVTSPAPQSVSPEKEMETLKNQTQMLKQQLDALQRRIEELEKRS